MAENSTGGVAGAVLRKARDHRIQMTQQPGQAHRSAAGWIIDYGLQNVTGGLMRAISTVPGQFVDKPQFSSPWHYHDCDLQVAIVLEGSIELAFAADRFVRAGKGDILFIPGEVLHNVSAPSADYQVAEVTFPGSFGTTEAGPPPPGHVSAARIFAAASAVRGETVNGMTEFHYPVEAPYKAKFALAREMRARAVPFVAGERRYGDFYRVVVVTRGYCEMEIDGVAQKAAVGDLLVAAGGSRWVELACSDDYEAVVVRLLSADTVGEGNG